VTSLGEISPIGRLFILGTFSKITVEAQMIGLLVSKGKVLYALTLTKKLVGQHFGRFF
jgi:hypothetical protein